MKIDIKKIQASLEKYPVVFAYLFGSVAKNRAGTLSDIDIAVMIEDNMQKSERFDTRLKMISELSSLLDVRIDLIVLNDAPIQLSYEVIKDGKLIICRDRSAKLDYETYLMSRYLDMRYYSKRHSEHVLNKIASEGLLS